MKIAAIDISSVFSQHWLVNEGSGKDFSAAMLSTLQAVAGFREGHDRVAICCDSGKSWRAAIWPSYKADRPNRGEVYREQLRQTVERLQSQGCVVFRAPPVSMIEADAGADLYAEADDVIGTLCAWAEEGGHEVTIFSADKDLMQLVSPTVRQFSPMARAMYDEAAVLEKFNLPPKFIPDFLALAGDKSDNYKPFDGVGDKRAVDLIKQCGSALAVFDPQHWDHLHEYIGTKPAESIKLRGREPAEKCLKIATVLRDLELDFDPLLDDPPPPVEDPAPEQTAHVTQPEMVAPAAPPAAQSVALQAPPAQAPAVMSVIQGGRQQTALAELPYWTQPGYLDSLWRTANCFVQARCFPNVNGPQQVMVVAMIAHEDGIGLATAMQHAYFVHGRLCWSATYLLMRAEMSGTVEEFDVVTSTDRECVIRCKRKGRTRKNVSFKIEEAERAELVKGGGNWKKWPVEMLLARCIARALRQEWRSIMGGKYVPEEMGETLPEEAILANARDARQHLGKAA